MCDGGRDATRPPSDAWRDALRRHTGGPIGPNGITGDAWRDASPVILVGVGRGVAVFSAVFSGRRCAGFVAPGDRLPGSVAVAYTVCRGRVARPEPSGGLAFAEPGVKPGLARCVAFGQSVTRGGRGQLRD